MKDIKTNLKQIAQPKVAYIAWLSIWYLISFCQIQAEQFVGGDTLEIDYCKSILKAITQLHQEADQKFSQILKENKKEKIASTLNPQAYFTILKHLSLPEGYVLDSVYEYIGGNGSPILYVRKQSDPPFQTAEEYKSRAGLKKLSEERKYDQIDKKMKEYQTLIQTDGSPEGFFELAVYSTLAGQYNLMWHANYFDTQVLITQKDIGDIIREINSEGFGVPLSSQQKKEAKKIDPTPIIEINEDAVDVTLVLFSKWGGFIKRTFTYQKSFPYKAKVNDQKLVEYDCGVLF